MTLTVGNNRKQALELLRLSALIEKDNLENDIAIAKLIIKEIKRRRNRPCRVWVRPWILRRQTYGVYENLLQELASEDSPAYKNYLRMDVKLFKKVLGRVAHRIEKQDTTFRKALPPGLRLAITLRYLATGDSYKSLHYHFRVGHITVGQIVSETCEAIVQEYMEELIPCPKTPEEWKAVSAKFSKRWNFHHTIGALDGKHVAMRCPNNGGSKWYNYKGFHSLVMLALVDADYRFLYIDVGASGCGSDGGIFDKTPIRQALEEQTLGLPDPETLPGGDVPVPYFIVGDDAFPLRTWMMKPYPQRGLSREKRLFNYRLSRARRVVENAFAIVSSR